MKELVFIVDDSDMMLTLVGTVLDDVCRVLTIPSAKKMFTILEKKTPDLILLDVEMPEMTGFEAIDILKNHPTWKDIPVVFLTGLGNDELQAKALRLGALGAISKSLKANLIKDAVIDYLTHESVKDEN